VAELAPVLAGGGIFGVLAWVIGFLLNAMRNDRVDFGKERAEFSKERAGLGKEIDDAEERANKAEARAERLQGLLDSAYEERRKALDLAAKQARAAASHSDELSKQREQLDAQAAELARLRGLVT
jgi:chromosome segregation ATPase